MTAADFVRGFLGIYREHNHNPASVSLLGGILDTSKDGLISFQEFQAFEGLLCVPDALYKTAFQLFDTKGTGAVSFGKKSIVNNYKSNNLFIRLFNYSNLINKILSLDYSKL